MRSFRRLFEIGVLSVVVLLTFTQRARGVASFARQTNLPCSACHTTIPELTPLGREFKLNGYTMTGIQKITSTATRGADKAGLSLNTWLPISAFFQVSFTSTNQSQPGTQNGSVEFPQAASLFLAGAFSSHAGGFMQVTYSGADDHFSWDNTDVRYANRTKLADKDLVYGIDLNNNPTVEDLWNDTPAWGFPFVSADSTPGPLAGTIVDGGLAQDVAGLGAYAMWDNHLYGALRRIVPSTSVARSLRTASDSTTFTESLPTGAWPGSSRTATTILSSAPTACTWRPRPIQSSARRTPTLISPPTCNGSTSSPHYTMTC